jgi:hypothetical protein
VDAEAELSRAAPAVAWCRLKPKPSEVRPGRHRFLPCASPCCLPPPQVRRHASREAGAWFVRDGKVCETVRLLGGRQPCSQLHPC